ncbi:hypothetical protein NCS52_01112300 [Fusarium sp. LHS14.1]|nr:hypothetical protein NCS52_01112300 [Fusarium sp. LHS14.1]
MPNAGHSRSAKYSHIAGNKPHEGLRAFLKLKWIAVLTLICGIAVCLFVFFYINWLSSQRFECPPWAVECTTHPQIVFFKRNTAVLQGVLTTAYHIGIVAIAYSLSLLAEIAMWPLHYHKTRRLVDIDSYLAATRGSILSTLRSLAAARSFGISALLLITLLSIASQQISGILVGWALHPANVTAVYQSQYERGGGLGLPFMQYFPGPAPSPGGIEDGISLYTIWSASPNREPLPETRDYIVDRIKLSKIGNITVQAPRIQRNVKCMPQSVNLRSVDDAQRAVISYEVETKYSLGEYSKIHTGTTKPWPIRIRRQPGLTSWVDDASILSLTRSNMTVIFGSFNDHIENSSTTKINEYTNFSSLACNIDIELQDDTAMIGRMKTPDLTSASQNAGSINNLTNSFLLPIWLGAATTFIGGSVAGLQPTYGKADSGWPSPRYTNYGPVQSWDNETTWNMSDISEFIDHSQSAIAQGIAGSWRDNADIITLSSEFYDSRIATQRTYILLIPVGIMVIAVIGLMVSNILAHRRLNMLEMETAETSVLIYRTQNDPFLQEKAEIMTLDEFSTLRVQLKIADNGEPRLAAVAPAFASLAGQHLESQP